MLLPISQRQPHAGTREPRRYLSHSLHTPPLSHAACSSCLASGPYSLHLPSLYHVTEQRHAILYTHVAVPQEEASLEPRYAPHQHPMLSPMLSAIPLAPAAAPTLVQQPANPGELPSLIGDDRRRAGWQKVAPCVDPVSHHSCFLLPSSRLPQMSLSVRKLVHQEAQLLLLLLLLA